MLSDVVTPSSYLTFNVTIAHIIGLVNAVYCAELLDIYAKAKRKNKLDENQFFIINRDYVRTKTSISIEEQYLCDTALSGHGIELIETCPDNPDKIKFDVAHFMGIIAEEDSKELSTIRKKVLKSQNKTEANRLKKESIKLNLHKSISCDNVKIKQALDEWLDAVFNSNFVTKETVEMFQSGIFNYAKSDVDLALKIIAIAKAQGWVNSVWAIESYEKEQRLMANKPVRATNIKIATKDKLSKKKY